ncbi:hypothetical protein [Streptomyces sp. NPDC003273]
MDELLADVRRTLQRAGFDLISDKEAKDADGCGCVGRRTWW